MMSSSLEKALKETWEKKEKFYEDTKGLSIREILEKIEGKQSMQKKEEPRVLKAVSV
jgi:hypothetical protein